MQFSNDRPIYRQIADYFMEEILRGVWLDGSKAPSVRELALNMGVNTHTVLKAYDYLQAHGIIEPRRGMGYYLTDGASVAVGSLRREEFFEVKAPDLFEQMRLLGISQEDLLQAYSRYLAGTENS